MNILIGGAWPYANGLHIGHIAALLPGDVLARYHRAKGDKVFYVSGSDCHGTPILVKAKQEKTTPENISNYYHFEFCKVFEKLGFSYDKYGKTSQKEHVEFVKSFHKNLYESKFVEERTQKQAYCKNCNSFLTDRYIVGKCPVCGEKARGDQCDYCGHVMEGESLKEPECYLCGEKPEFVDSTQLYLLISKLKGQLIDYVNLHQNWRKNARGITNRYIDEGLRDRAITRNLDWGIDVPYDFGDESASCNKKIYIWAENVLGYLSMSQLLCKERGENFEHLWDKNSDDVKHYYVHGKDNVPFHSIILPSLLLGNNKNWRLPDELVSCEHLTLEGKKISSSQGYAIWAKDIVKEYDADSLRYYFLAYGPEKRDSNFLWSEYVAVHNSELVGCYGNFVNRTLVFIKKYFNGVVCNGDFLIEEKDKIQRLFDNVGNYIEKTQFKDALSEIFNFIRECNKFFDVNQPWKTIEDDKALCEQTLFTCVQYIGNIAVLLKPFLPFSSEKIFSWLGFKNDWKPQFVKCGFNLEEIDILFQRLDKSVAEKEKDKLNL